MCFETTTVFQIEDVLIDEITEERISPIQGEIAEISIPIREVFASAGNQTLVRMASFLFRNMSRLLSGNLEGADNDT